MCGIAGFVDSSIDRMAVIKSMTDAIVHRGPDAEGFWLDENSGVTLGHRRLSIRDLSPGGAQPMVSVLSWSITARSITQTRSESACRK